MLAHKARIRPKAGRACDSRPAFRFQGCDEPCELATTRESLLGVQSKTALPSPGLVVATSEGSSFIIKPSMTTCIAGVNAGRRKMVIVYAAPVTGQRP